MLQEWPNIAELEEHNKQVVRRLLQTIAAANIQEPYFSQIKEILEEATKNPSSVGLQRR